MVLTRRRALVAGAASASLLDWANAWAASQPFTPEKGAQLLLLRPTVIQPGEGDALAANIAAFSAATGVSVQTETYPPEDIPGRNVLYLANTAGADVCWAPGGTAHLVNDRMINVSEITDYLASKYGPWTPLARDYGMQYGRWFNVPATITGVPMAYRVSWLRQAGFESFPKTTDELVRLCQALKRIGHPAGFALGRSFTEGNCFAYWLLWAFGGQVANESNRPALESDRTLAAIEYLRQLYPNLAPGILGWKDGSGSAAFLAGECGLTNATAALYTQAKRTTPAIAADMAFAPMPIGPVGMPTAMARVDSMMIYRYEKYPQASKALITFLMEAPQYPKLVTGAAGFVTPVLQGFGNNPLFQSDPKLTWFATAGQDARPLCWPQAANQGAAQVFAYFVVQEMFAAAGSGQAEPRVAMRRAQQQVERFYRYG
ncbi:MAG: extracellular solute-binding protein [Proteobacteria bacterium]|nr:extracellular solute-binding protein [Pseudomonadota bacterium]